MPIITIICFFGIPILGLFFGFAVILFFVEIDFYKIHSCAKEPD